MNIWLSLPKYFKWRYFYRTSYLWRVRTFWASDCHCNHPWKNGLEVRAFTWKLQSCHLPRAGLPACFSPQPQPCPVALHFPSLLPWHLHAHLTWAPGSEGAARTTPEPLLCSAGGSRLCPDFHITAIVKYSVTFGGSGWRCMWPPGTNPIRQF